MGKEQYILRLIDSMQSTVDSLSKGVLIAVNRDEVMLKKKAFSAYGFNACLMGVDFVYINVCISALAALKADNVHTKRYHWKNVVAGISEGIKYIYTFKGNEKKTLIGYLKTILNDSDMMIPEIAESLSVLQVLLDRFTANWDGKDMRDIALHYDKSTEKLIKETVGITDEEPYASLLSDYLLIMNIIHCICMYGFIQSLISRNLSFNDILQNGTGSYVGVDKHKNAIHALLKEKTFKTAIEENLEEYGKRFLDSCSVFEKLHKVYELLGCKGELKLSDNHFGKLYKLHNLYALVLYSMLDILSITDSYLSSNTELEAALNMRYFLIVKTSVLTHIVGYTEKEASVSLWSEIKGLIPESDSQLHDMAATMESHLRESVMDLDIKRKRAKLVHLTFSKNKPGNVKEILSVLDTFDSLSEFYKVLNLIKLLVKVIKFLDSLILSMGKEITIENQKQLDKIRSMFSSLRDMIENNVKDKALKEELQTSLDANEFKMMDLLKKR